MRRILGLSLRTPGTVARTAAEAFLARAVPNESTSTPFERLRGGGVSKEHLPSVFAKNIIFWVFAKSIIYRA